MWRYNKEDYPSVSDLSLSIAERSNNFFENQDAEEAPISKLGNASRVYPCLWLGESQKLL